MHARISKRRRPLFRRVLLWTGGFALGLYVLVALVLLGLKWVFPPTTAVQAERRIEAWAGKQAYRKRYLPVRSNRIAPALRHAVIAAEDSRFYQHHGLDWVEIRNAVEERLEDGRLRGASTITQQLVKNLFLTTRLPAVRKGLEVALVPLAEAILGKERILELYVNVVEWGPGVFGAEAAARYHYGVSAAQLGREQAARLAAVLPAPRRRRPSRMDQYSSVILSRMRQMGW